MHWRQLRTGCRLYNEAEDEGVLEDYEEDYTEAIDGRDPVVLLRAWQKRLAYDKWLLRSKTRQVSQSIEKLSHLRFESCELPSIRETVVMLFDTFDGVVKHTAASKVLHVLAPSLFVMWDDAVRTGYGVYDKYDAVWKLNQAETFGDLYYLFLQRIQREAREAVASFGQKNGISDFEEAASGLCKSIYAKGVKPLSKLVDEFNIVRFTNGHPSLWR